MRTGFLVVLPLLLGACKKGDGDLGAKTANIASDTAVLRDASAAANEVIRNATDCDAVKAVLPEARRKLDEIAPKIRTPTGQTTLEALKKQVRTIAEACP